MAAPKNGMPVIRKSETPKAPARSEAEVVSRSAEVVNRGTKKPGRKPSPENVRNTGFSCPSSLLEAIDQLAAESCGHNRSLAIVQVLRGKLKLPPEKID